MRIASSHPAAILFLALLGCTASTPPVPAPEGPPPAPPVAAPTQAGPNDVVVATDAGDVVITPVHHGTLYFRAGDTVVWLDPWTEGKLDGPKADVVLLTDVHPDHLDPAGIAAVSKAGTVLVAPEAVADQLEGREVQHVLANGDHLDLGAMGLDATPMYNLVRGPEAGKLFHDKGRGNGYLVAFGGKRIYIAGDTECTDEMRALKDIDVAFLPMNLPYTMPPSEAAACAKAFSPAVLVPYHYRDSDLAELEAGLAGAEGITLTRREFYQTVPPAPAPG